jgi:putative aldouronate transport system permease protein
MGSTMEISTGKTGRIKNINIKKKLELVWRYRMKYLFMLPAMIVLFTFAYRPLAWIVMAFRDYNIITGFEGQAWVGLKYFKEFFRSPEAFRVIRNTVGISLTGLIIGFPAPIILALMLNEVRKQFFKKIVQTVTFLPHFISFIAISGLVYQLLTINGGSVNELIVFFGGKPVNFLAIGELFWPLLAVTNTFKEGGYSAIIYLAALTAIDQELYEAAVVDGAGKWKQLTNITIPGILPTIIIMFILRMGHIMSASLEQVNALQNGFNMAYSDTLEMFMLREGIQRMNYSFTTAVGFFQSMVNISLVLFTNYIARRLSNKEQGLF